MSKKQRSQNLSIVFLEDRNSSLRSVFWLRKEIESKDYSLMETQIYKALSVDEIYLFWMQKRCEFTFLELLNLPRLALVRILW